MFDEHDVTVTVIRVKAQNNRLVPILEAVGMDEDEVEMVIKYLAPAAGDLSPPVPPSLSATKTDPSLSQLFTPEQLENNANDINTISQFIKNDCDLGENCSRRYAEKLVLQFKITSVGKMKIKHRKGELVPVLQGLVEDEDDIGMITDALNH